MGGVVMVSAHERFVRKLRAEGKRRSTISGYLDTLNAYFNSIDGADPYASETVESYLVGVADRCSRSTHLAYWKGLKSFFEWRESEGGCENPMRGLRRPRLSPDESERDAPLYTETDRDALLAVCPEWTWIGLRDRTLILALWYTPLRASELCGLLLEDVDWEAQEFRVRHGKGGNRYSAFTPIELMLMVKRYLEQRPHESRMLWTDKRGGPFSPHALALMLRRMAKRAGIEKPVYPHAFRHNFRVRCVMLGMTDVETAALLGQRTVRSTYGYGRKVLQAQARARYRERLAG